ncbi:farnesyl pyrophosphate synthase-like isoform X2 [Pseudophryne corroboree]|uniref:farnesyl pyrophosphate synthase-like isoform X2 n=1 Tax=Pseudophryne corroboree TaxID=495146 RepID=UPI0030819E80
MASVKASDIFQDFSSFFEKVVQDLTVEECGHPEIGVAISRLREVLEYNAPGGKYNRGSTVLASVRELLPLTLQDVETIERAQVVGWCIELLSQSFLVADDIMDKSETRRGKTCWYKKISYQTELGQTLDLIFSKPGKMDLAQYTETRYKSVAKYKTAFSCFYLPIAAAMFMAEIDQEEDHRNAKTILLEMGELYQVQNDYQDCYGDPSIIGKIGTDIQEKKCTWLVVEALKRVTPEQRKILEENYGHDDVDKVQKVKQLYEDLGMSAVYRQYEEESYQRLQILISQHANGLPKEIFLGLARKIYKRQK